MFWIYNYASASDTIPTGIIRIDQRNGSKESSETCGKGSFAIKKPLSENTEHGELQLVSMIDQEIKYRIPSNQLRDKDDNSFDNIEAAYSYLNGFFFDLYGDESECGSTETEVEDNNLTEVGKIQNRVSNQILMVTLAIDSTTTILTHEVYYRINNGPDILAGSGLPSLIGGVLNLVVLANLTSAVIGDVITISVKITSLPTETKTVRAIRRLFR